MRTPTLYSSTGPRFERQPEFATDPAFHPEQPSRPRTRAARGHRDQARPREMRVPRFNAADLIRRARRNAEFSQREMAAVIGVSKSTLARAEVDGGAVSMAVLLAALEVGGIQLIAVDLDGDEAFTMRSDAVRDRGGRKLPAHLQARVARAAESVPEHWIESDRRNAPVRWRLRSARRPPQLLEWQHPGPEDVDILRRRESDERAFQQIVARIRGADAMRRANSVPVDIRCTCSAACIMRSTICLPTCPCQCESPLDSRHSSPPSGLAPY